MGGKIKISDFTRPELEYIRSVANLSGDQSLILEELNKDQYYDYAIMQRLGLSRKRYYAIKSVVLDKVERIILSDGYKEATKKQ